MQMMMRLMINSIDLLFASHGEKNWTNSEVGYLENYEQWWLVVIGHFYGWVQFS